MGRLTLLETLQGHTDRVWHCAWSPSGLLLATCGGDKRICLWVREGTRWVLDTALEVWYVLLFRKLMAEQFEESAGHRMV